MFVPALRSNSQGVTWAGGTPAGTSLPIGDFYTMGPREAAKACQLLGIPRVIPMHWGTFDLTDEPILEPPVRFLAEAARRGLGPERAWVLRIGETRAF